MASVGNFIIAVSLLTGAWVKFQDEKMTIRQREVQSQFTGKCISLRNPWEERDLLQRAAHPNRPDCDSFLSID
jgi:hypothetical protein